MTIVLTASEKISIWRRHRKAFLLRSSSFLPHVTCWQQYYGLTGELLINDLLRLGIQEFLSYIPSFFRFCCLFLSRIIFSDNLLSCFFHGVPTSSLALRHNTERAVIDNLFRRKNSPPSSTASADHKFTWHPYATAE